MIQSFKDKDTEQLYHRQFVRRFSGIERQALRRLRLLDGSETMQAVAMLPAQMHAEPRDKFPLHLALDPIFVAGLDGDKSLASLHM